MNFETIKQLSEFMRDLGAHKFSVDGLEIEFGINAIKHPMPPSIDDKEAEREELKERLKKAISEEEADIFWST